MFARLKEYVASKLRRIDWSDVALRAAKTGVQVAIAVGIIDAVASRNWPAVYTAALAGVSAAVSIVWNAVKQAFSS